jgi:hypothetical protein
MEKKNYYTPEVKFHQLKAKVEMLAGTTVDEGTDPTFEAKGGMFFFDEDED